MEEIYPVEEQEPSGEEVPSAIQEYYSDSTIFVTGGTGFLGRLLIEKLLRTCHSLSKIYILMRAKKGKSLEERFKTYFEDIVSKKLFVRLSKNLLMMFFLDLRKIEKRATEVLEEVTPNNGRLRVSRPGAERRRQAEAGGGGRRHLPRRRHGALRRKAAEGRPHQRARHHGPSANGEDHEEFNSEYLTITFYDTELGHF